MNTIKEHSILVSKWGYDQTNVTFYSVLKRTPKMVTLQELETNQTECEPGKFSAKVKPGKPLNEKPIRRKVLVRFGEEVVRIGERQFARPWNWRAQRETSYA
ncbi:hypothetical protein SCOR_33000 [Sulfidibacter corallicola]|uniref:Uncharacterized protein n=1 Tax=Sulfidibacter corallicola TaxID=2818388 RepID=A0A8A4TJB6_SULCO|nr:hypothetical protein [Sulfidibacter corallicola]QTD49640.1 hypothetical protein J3U87_29000 [Sulfidibacter corallicola]